MLGGGFGCVAVVCDEASIGGAVESAVVNRPEDGSDAQAVNAAMITQPMASPPRRCVRSSLGRDQHPGHEPNIELIGRCVLDSVPGRQRCGQARFHHAWRCGSRHRSRGRAASLGCHDGQGTAAAACGNGAHRLLAWHIESAARRDSCYHDLAKGGGPLERLPEPWSAIVRRRLELGDLDHQCGHTGRAAFAVDFAAPDEARRPR